MPTAGRWIIFDFNEQLPPPTQLNTQLYRTWQCCDHWYTICDRWIGIHGVLHLPHHKTFTQFTFVQAAQLLLTKHNILNKTQTNNLLFTSANNLPAFTTSSQPHATLLSYLGSQLAHLSHAKPPVLKTLHLHYVRVKSLPNKITN